MPVKVSISSEGTIIECRTMYQNETPNYGDPCANEEFYNQFNGKTQGDYEDTRIEIEPGDRKDYIADMDAITGATVTSSGYKLAIMNAFEDVKILKGGAN
jgi:Na+-transporting NADH:ubiquinone oxidoreductase subunit NqrC